MAEERKKLSKGCMVALIVVGALIVLALVAMTVCYIYKDELVDFGVAKMTDAVSIEIKKDLPEGYTAETVDSIMIEFKAAFKEKKITSGEMQDISNRLQDIMKEGNYTPEKGAEFLEMIKKAMEDDVPSKVEN